MNNFQIETAQNVSIQQNAAGIKERCLAYLVDLLIITSYVIVVLLVITGLKIEDSGQWVLWLVLGLPMFLYFLLWELFWDGKTPGKYALDIKVVRLDGTKATFSNHLVRWLIRLVDISLAFGSVAICCILVSGKGQRLGDIAAGTTVISTQKRVRFNQTMLADLPLDYTPRYPQVTVFNDQEIDKIKTIYREAKRDANHKVIIELSNKAAEMMRVSPQETPLLFIERVLEDYYFYTQNS